MARTTGLSCLRARLPSPCMRPSRQLRHRLRRGWVTRFAHGRAFAYHKPLPDRFGRPRLRVWVVVIGRFVPQPAPRRDPELLQVRIAVDHLHTSPVGPGLRFRRHRHVCTGRCVLSRWCGPAPCRGLDVDQAALSRRCDACGGFSRPQPAVPAHRRQRRSSAWVRSVDGGLQPLRQDRGTPCSPSLHVGKAEESRSSSRCSLEP